MMTYQTKIIAVVGMAGSGKSESCAYLKSKGMPVLRFGDQTDIGLKEQGLPRTEQNERKYREKLRRTLGMAAYAVKIKPRILKAMQARPRLICLDGLYSWEEYEYLSRFFPDLILLAIYAGKKTRYRRLSGRQERPLTPEAAGERDKAEIIHSNKGGPIAFCDYLIINNSSRPALQRAIDRFLSQL